MTTEHGKKIEFDLLEFFELLSPDSILLSIRSLDLERQMLVKEFRWQKNESLNTPETEQEISIFGTVGGDAAIKKAPEYVPEIDRDGRFYPRGYEYVAAGYPAMKAYPLFGLKDEVIGVMQIYFGVRNYACSAKEEKAIQKLCRMLERLIFSHKLTQMEREAALHELSRQHAREINHHFKNQVVPIGIFASQSLRIVEKCATEKRAPTEEELSKILRNDRRIVNSVIKLEETMHDVLRFGPAELHKEATSIAEFAAPIIELMASAHDLKISYTAITNRIVNIDRRRLEILIQELLQNAKKATEKHGGEIHCRLYDRVNDAKDSVCLEVTNAGEIPNEIIDRIFDPFFTTDEQGGTGVGLSGAKLTMEQHGGAIKAESANGKTSIKIYIPI